MRDPDMTEKLLVELSRDEDSLSGNEISVLDIQAHQIGPGERRKIRDEIIKSSQGDGFKTIDYIHLVGDSLVAHIKGANEETVRRSQGKRSNAFNA